MSQEFVEKVLGRLLTDDAFRARAAEDLRAACDQEGYRLSEEELRAVCKLQPGRVLSVVEGLDDSIKRFSVSSSLPRGQPDS